MTRGRGKPCVRCGWPKWRHDTMPTDECLSYVEPAPNWLRWLNAALSAINRRFPS